MPGAIQWNECLARERPGRRALLGIVIVAIATATALSAQEWFLGALAAVALTAVTAEGWAGCRCSLGPEGIMRSGPFGRRHLPWTDVGAFMVRSEGATLARVTGRGAISFHLGGVTAADRVRVQQALRAWHDWWTARRATSGGSDHD